jgi:hypothetical protein
LPLNCFTTGTIIDNNNATVATITLWLLKELMVFNFTLSNPSDRHYLYLVLTNGTLEVQITLLQTLMYCTCGATTGTVSVPTTADTIDEK